MYSQVVAHSWWMSRSEWTKSTFIWFLSGVGSYMISHVFPIVGVVITRETGMSKRDIRPISNATGSTMIQNNLCIVWKFDLTFFTRKLIWGTKNISLVKKKRIFKYLWVIKGRKKKTEINLRVKWNIYNKLAVDRGQLNLFWQWKDANYFSIPLINPLAAWSDFFFFFFFPRSLPTGFNWSQPKIQYGKIMC